MTQISHRAAICLGVMVLTTSVFAQQTQRNSGATAPTAPRPTTAPRTTPAVTTPPAVPADYVIGAEDVLGVVFWKEADISGDVTVRPDGLITLPLIGEMKATGLKPDALRDAIQSAAGKYLTEPNVSVIVRQLNSRKVFITGQVANSGSYPLTGPLDVVQVIALAGGLTEYAKADQISIMRNENGKVRYFKFNYKEVSRGKKLEQNIVLLPRDTIVVP